MYAVVEDTTGVSLASDKKLLLAGKSSAPGRVTAAVVVIISHEIVVVTTTTMTMLMIMMMTTTTMTTRTVKNFLFRSILSNSPLLYPMPIICYVAFQCPHSAVLYISVVNFGLCRLCRFSRSVVCSSICIYAAAYIRFLFQACPCYWVQS